MKIFWKIKINHLKAVFTETNDYPIRVVNIGNNVTNNNSIATNNNKTNKEQVQLFLSFSGNQEIQIVSKKRK